MNKFEAINTFIQVVERKSFSAAADALHIAKSIVSKRIKDLEDHLGIQLIQRTTRRIHLTQSGEYYYQRCQNILSELEETHQILTEQHTQLSGKIKITVPLSFSLRHLQTGFYQFLTQYPKINLDIDFNDRQLDMIEEGFDLGIRIGELQDSTLIAQKLTRIGFATLASPDYIKRMGEPHDLSQLVQHQWLVYNNYPSGILWPFQQGQLKERVRCIANSGDALVNFAVQGLGLVVLPTFMVYEEVMSGTLIPVLQKHPQPSLNAYLIYPSRRYQARRIRVFIDYLLNLFNDEPVWDRVISSPPSNAEQSNTHQDQTDQLNK